MSTKSSGKTKVTEEKTEIKVGIPRALHFYKYYPIWKAFLENLGCKLYLSPFTNKQIMEQGTKLASGELCIPLKLYYGHVIELERRYPDLDYIFVPRYVSLEKESYFCPKFLVLPETVRHTIQTGIPILTLEVNAKKQTGIEGALDVGKQLHKSELEAGKAWVMAIEQFRHFKQQVQSGEYLEKLIGSKLRKKKVKQSIREDLKGKYPIDILVLGHAYNVYERNFNMDLIERLKAMDARVRTLEMLPSSVFKEPVTINKQYQNYWGNCEEILQATRYYLTKGRDEIDGVIFLISFACGPDSLISELIMHDMKKRKLPFQALILDEHSGESGLVTRIESFVDMVRRKRYKDALVKDQQGGTK